MSHTSSAQESLGTITVLATFFMPELAEWIEMLLAIFSITVSFSEAVVLSSSEALGCQAPSALLPALAICWYKSTKLRKRVRQEYEATAG